MEYLRHPLSRAWPDMTPDEFLHLCDSVENSGLREPIVIFQGEILDGWHRFKACLQVSIAPIFDHFEGTREEAETLVRDKHNRRSLTLTQRMTAIAVMRSWAPSGAAGHKSKVLPGNTLTIDGLAEEAGASRSSAQQVKTVIAHGQPEVVDAMRNGILSAKKAAVIAKLPKADQAAAIQEPLPKAVKTAAEPAPADDGPSDSELEADVATERAVIVFMDKLLAEDDTLAAAVAECNRLQALNNVLQLRVNGLMNEKNAAIKLLKARDRQIVQLKAQLKAVA